MCSEISRKKNENIGEIVGPETEMTPEAGTPEAAVSNALTAVETRDVADPVISSEWMDGLRGWIDKKWEKGEARVEKTKKKIDELVEKYPNAAFTGGVVIDAGRVGTVLIFKILGSLLKFAKTAIMKKGKISMKEGWDIGKEMFNFDNKKDKK